eukprot:978308_1
MHFPPWTETLLQPLTSHNLRGGPCALHIPAFFTCFLQPGCPQVFRLAPCAIQSPPWTTRLVQSATVHFRRARFGPVDDFPIVRDDASEPDFVSFDSMDNDAFIFRDSSCDVDGIGVDKEGS